jgi:hypothetical protein
MSGSASKDGGFRVPFGAAEILRPLRASPSCLGPLSVDTRCPFIGSQLATKVVGEPIGHRS